ncbi:response regulator [Roseateles sp. DAIF2]|uniref:hybrid sensor histidine kinase/response regulator n=1 Tax=Roseateles sp. DAIF2 TaxID=2714952 RepID=UPI0018A2BFB6|nr:ATP-binding protein [Roseateles sp. DAIF2]QPF75573.1 response regulator [Roseateles sp. DAIF2]
MDMPLEAAADPLAASASALLRRYRRLLWLVSLPLLALVLLLALGHGLSAHRNAVAGLERGAAQQHAALQALARDAEEHVLDLRRFVERELITAARAPDALLAEALQHDAMGHTLDELPQLLRPGLAQLLWPGAKRPDAAALWRLQAFAALTEPAHNRHADLARSYHLAWPETHALLYPWLPSAQVAQGLGRPDWGLALQAWYARPEFGAARPEANSAQRAFWLPRPDEGLLVHGAPVYAGESFRGLVATELRLDSLSRAAAAAAPAGASWWLLGEQGEVLARSADAGAAPEPAALAAARAADGHAGADGGWRLVALPLQSAPWTLVAAQRERALLAQIAPELLPFGLIALALLALVLLGQWLLRQRVIEPALAVMRYLSDKSRDPLAPEPALSPRWQPWVRVISATFAAQREARERERRSEATKSAIVDHALAAIITTDRQGRVAEWNPAAATMFGRTRAAVIGQPVGELIIPQRLRPAHAAGLARAGSGRMQRAGERLEMVGLRADGREFPIEMVLARTDVDGDHHYTAFINDISAQRLAQAEIERQREALRQSEKLTAMGSLLAGVAHELNNPLSIVLGRAALLEGKAAGQGALADDARRIRDAAERCGRIVRTFLNMARAKPETRQPVPLNELVRAALELLGYGLRSNGIRLELALADSLPELPADPDRLGQLVMNLIVNAQQALASQAGERRLALATGLEADGAWVWLRVADNGPGVPATLRERIFTPFFTTKGDGLGELQGTGLGLAVARGVAREHGGELLLEDEAPRGASFLLRLPLAGGSGPMPGPAPAPISNPPRQLRLLVVDDEADLAAMLREALEQAGYEVATAESGRVALELLDTARFEAVVSDLRMPEMDGAALWRVMRERWPALATRMLIITGDTLSPAAAEFLHETGCALLEKPFTPAELVARIKELTEAR